MRWYEPSVGDEAYPDSDNVASGAYIFKPAEDNQQSAPYSKLSKIDTLQGNIVGSFILYFADEESGENYTAHIRLLEGQETIEYEVQM